MFGGETKDVSGKIAGQESLLNGYFHMNRLLSLSYDGGGHDEKPNGDAVNIKVDKLTGLSVQYSLIYSTLLKILWVCSYIRTRRHDESEIVAIAALILLIKDTDCHHSVHLQLSNQSGRDSHIVRNIILALLNV